MNPFLRLREWLDIRPNEQRPLFLAFFGSFFVLGFMILARSMREALYLSTFDVKTLPYITVSATLLGLPAVSLFTRLLSRHSPRRVLLWILFAVALGLGALWPFLQRSPAAVVVFYLWTALGTILLTSGFWIVISEHFPLRGAKRLFGFISAGGTVGAMVVGTSLTWLTKAYGMEELIPFLLSFLLLFSLMQAFLPKPRRLVQGEAAPESRGTLLESLKEVAAHPHLRSIAAIVALATLASTLLDYQFKELVRGSITTKAGLVSFFGAFYGWTGTVSLIIQLLFTSRILSKWGIGWALAVLPFILFGGSLALLIVPGMILATGVRGMDNSLRKSLHRAAIEVLYVPLPSWLRRRTKTFIDSMVDSLAEGVGAGLIFLWVTWGGQPSRYLSIAVAALSLGFLTMTKRMNREYYSTLVGRLKEGEESAERLFETDERFAGRDLLSASFTHLNLQETLKEKGIVFKPPSSPSLSEKAGPEVSSLSDLLESEDPGKIARALKAPQAWKAEHVPALMRLLPRDLFYRQAVDILKEMGSTSLPLLLNCLEDEGGDFVIRRRIPRILAEIEDPRSSDALLRGLRSGRFEIRYRSAIALVKRKRKNLFLPQGEWKVLVWEALSFELNRDRAVWEMQRILDPLEEGERDDLNQSDAAEMTKNPSRQRQGRGEEGAPRALPVEASPPLAEGDPPKAGAAPAPFEKIELRGQLSLEHAFRLLTLVLDPAPVKTAYQGILLGDEKLKSFSLEYLEHVLPRPVREKLWPFIGDLSDFQREKRLRPVDEVVDDLLKTGATLFTDEISKESLRNVIAELKKGSS